MKRYRCADCLRVHTVRPLGYWRKFLAPIEAIVSSLESKLEKNRWANEWTRQRQQYWWRGFRRRLVAEGFIGEPALSGLFELLRRAIIVATHSLKYFEVHRSIEAFYRTFAFTPACGLRYP